MRGIVALLVALGTGGLLSGCAIFGHGAESPAKKTEMVSKESAVEKAGEEKERKKAPEHAQEQPEVDSLEAWLNFNVEPGMKRAKVEQALGEPRHTSRTKDDELYLLYENESHYRGVVYDEFANVVRTYP